MFFCVSGAYTLFSRHRNVSCKCIKRHQIRYLKFNIFRNEEMVIEERRKQPIYCNTDTSWRKTKDSSWESAYKWMLTVLLCLQGSHLPGIKLRSLFTNLITYLYNNNSSLKTKQNSPTVCLYQPYDWHDVGKWNVWL